MESKANNKEIFINYSKIGSGSPLLLISGHGGKISDWHYQIDFLKDYFSVIAFDLRGSGKSSRPDYAYNLDMILSDIHWILEELKISEPLHLCGLSMGAIIAQGFALQNPDRVKTLTLISAFPYFNAEKLSMPLFRELENLDDNAKAKKFIPFLFSKKFAQSLLQTEAALQSFIQFLRSEDAASLQDLENQAHIMNQTDLRSHLSSLKHPTLILAGKEDSLVPLSYKKILKEKIPNATLEIFQEGGHLLHIDNADKVNTLILDFIRKNAL